MQLNCDFEKRALILPAQYQLVSSTLPGVSRMMLDRAGGEVARATTI
jgi:anti-sigma factor ChrR (cupin superfamily)